MRTYKFRSLPYDVARCYGSNCNSRSTCARHQQVELDAQGTDIKARRVYTDVLLHSDECPLRIEVDP